MTFVDPPYYSCSAGLTGPCCDLCIMKKFAHAPADLTSTESCILTLRDQIMTRRFPVDQGAQEQGDRPGNEIDVDAPRLPVRNGTGEGPRRGDRLEACRNALKTWRYDTWKRDFKRTILTPDVVLPDKVLLKLASQAQFKTPELIRDEIPGWILANCYGEAVLKVLEPIDKGWAEDIEQKREAKRVKRAQQSVDNKIRREENARAVRRRASDEQKTVQQVSASQPPQSYSGSVGQQALVSQPLQSYSASVTNTGQQAPVFSYAAHPPLLPYPSYYPRPFHGYYPHAYPHPQAVLNQSASSSSSQPTPYIPQTHHYYMQPPASFVYAPSL